MADSGINKVYMVEQPETDIPDETKGLVLFNSQRYVYTGEYTQEEGDYYYMANNKVAVYKMIHGTDQTLWRQLERFMHTLPNGPYYADSRDGDVTVHNINMNQPPMAYYQYAGGNGELLSFTVKTTKKKKNLQVTQSSKIDPKTKQVTSTISQAMTDESATIPTPIGEQVFGEIPDKYNWTLNKSLYGSSELTYEEFVQKQQKAKIDAIKDPGSTFREYRANYQITADDVRQFLIEQRQNFDEQLKNATETGDIAPLLSINSMSKFVVKRKVPVRIMVDPTDYGGDPGPNTHHGALSQSDASNVQKRWSRGIKNLQEDPNIIYLGPKVNWKDSPAGQGQGGGAAGTTWTPKVEVIMEKEFQFEIDGARIFSSVMPQDLQNMWANSELGDSITKQLDGSLKVIGNPSLRSSKIINISNLSDRYSGGWYTKKVKHIVTPGQGYVCDCEVIRKGLPIRVANTEMSLDMNKIYSEYHKLGKETLANKYENRRGYNDVKQTFIENYTDENGKVIRRNSEVVSIQDYQDTGDVVIRPATEDQVNIFEERAAVRDKQDR